MVRKLIELGYERALRAASLGSAVRLGQEQLPRIWVLHRQVFNTLDMEHVPGLYMTQFPLANAYAIGTQKPIVVLNSELVRILDDDGRRVVLAHEAAHIHSDHQLYRTALLILLLIGDAVRLPILAGLPLLAIKLALLEWSRSAELSCDRAAALVTRDPLAVCRALMVIAAGEAADELNLDAFIAQGMDYSEKGTGPRAADEDAAAARDHTSRCPSGGCGSCSTGCRRASTTGWRAATTCAAARSRRRARRRTRPGRSTRTGSGRPFSRRGRRWARWASSLAIGSRRRAARPTENDSKEG